MELSEAQKVRVRFYCGYDMYGNQAMPANGFRFSTVYGQLEYKMNQLQDAEYDMVVNTFLPNLQTLETDTFTVRENIDTDQAAVWYHNKNEIKDREKLFRIWRLRLCSFMGTPPGKGLAGGAVQMAV